MQLFRKILFYIFTLIYVILCPLIIMYAFGYIFKPGVESNIIETGVISLATVPQGASVYIKDDLYPEVTPAVLTEILPGEYDIRIFLEGYNLWTQTIPVEVSKATVFEKILLIPKTWKHKELAQGPFRGIVPVRGEPYFIVKKSQTLEDHFLYLIGADKIMPIISANSPFQGSKVLSYFAVTGSNTFLIHIDSAAEKRILKAQFKDPEITLTDITGLFSGDPARVEWCPEDAETMFYSLEGTLNKANIASGAVYPEFLKGIRGYGLFEKKVYSILAEDMVVSMAYDKGARTVLLDDPDLAGSIFKEKGLYRIKPLTEDTILFLSEKGELLSNHLPYHFVSEGVRDIVFHHDSNRVLVWMKNKIGILDFTTEETENVVFEKGPTLSWIYTGGQDISSAFWAYDGSHVVLMDEGNVVLVEPETHGVSHVDQVVSIGKGTGICYSEDTGKLYYIEKSTGKLSSIAIVPSGEVWPVEQTEPLPVEEK